MVSHSVFRRNLLLILILAGMAGTQTEVSAAWSRDPSFNTRISPPHYHVLKAVPGGQGEMIVLLLAPGANSSVPDTLALQRVNADGSLGYGAQPTIVATNGIIVGENDVDLLGYGSGAFVAWRAYDPAGSGYSAVLVNQVDQTGTVLWGNGIVAGNMGSPLTASQLYPDLALNDQGWVEVVWSDGRNGNNDIYLQALDPVTGVAQLPLSGAMISSSTNHDNAPVIFMTGSGNNVIGWLSSAYSTPSPNSNDVHKTVMDADLNPVIWNEVISNAGDADAQLWGVNSRTTNGGGALVFTTLGGENLKAQFMDNQGFNLDYFTSYKWLIDATTYAHSEIAVAPDEHGGIFFTWTKFSPSREIVVYHFNNAGSSLWGGAAGVIPDPGFVLSASAIISDGLGGAYVGLEGNSPASFYLQHINAGGVNLWPSARPLSTNPQHLTLLDLIPDGQGGALGAITGINADHNNIAFAQNMDYFGYLGDPAPVAVSALDFPQDQGGVVRLDWQASYLDVLGQEGLDHYSIWRRYAGGAKRAGSDLADPRGSGLGAEVIAAQKAAGWNYVSNATPLYQGVYSFDAPTYGDSTGTSLPVTEFKVIAHGQVIPGSYWESNIVAGTSVDNLAPGAPLALTASAATGSPRLSWKPSGYHDEDWLEYRVYRSATPGVSPSGGATLAGTATDTVYVDPVPGGTWYYVVTAVDVHGNESTVSNEAMTLNASGVGETLPGVARISGVTPNPFNPKTWVHYELPAAEHVQVSLYNLQGRRVALLADGVESAGQHQVSWNGLDDSGVPQPSGVYLARMVTAEGVQARKMMLAR